MKYLRFIWKNAIRNRRRAILTVLSIAIAIATISILQTILVAFNMGVEVADESRLVVRNSTSLIFPLPLAYRSRIAAMPGVKSVTVANWFGGTYREKKNFFAKFAVEAESYFPMFPEFGIPPDQYQAFLEDRKACVVGKKLAQQYGFKVGDTVPIIGDIFPGIWEFNVRAIYQGTKPGTDETAMIFHWKYLDESVPPRRQGQVGWYMVQLDTSATAEASGGVKPESSDQSDRGARIAKAIDAQFENSPEQTLTETEKAFNMEFVRMMGNVELLVRMIGGAVVFAILLIAANTMAMAARERSTEIAILKTIGFRNSQLAALVVAEGLLLSLVGWAVGSGIAWYVTKGVEKAFPTMFPVFPLKASTVGMALGVALLTGAVSGLFPALQAARTSIAGAMRKVA